MKKATWDLDAFTLTLDYKALQAVATIAVKHSLEEIERRLRRWRHHENSETVSLVEAQSMRECAEDLEKATVALYYLSHGVDRQTRQFSLTERRMQDRRHEAA